MISIQDKIWDNTTTRQLADVLSLINNSDTMQKFLRDVMTEKEIIEISSRLEAARMLQLGTNYAKIIKQTKLSSRTVARISDWVKKDNNGYTAAISKISTHQKHILPAHTE